MIFIELFNLFTKVKLIFCDLISSISLKHCRNKLALTGATDFDVTLHSFKGLMEHEIMTLKDPRKSRGRHNLIQTK